MDNKSDVITFQDLYDLIHLYVDANQPDVKETFAFLGSVIVSLINKININEDEKEIYLTVYEKLINKKIEYKIKSA